MAKLNSTIVTGNLRVTSDIYLSGSLSNGTNTYTLPSASGTLALTSNIPTDNNQLTNGAGYITSSGSCASATTAESLSSNSMSVSTAVTSNTSNMTIGGSLTNITIWNEYNQRILVNGILQPASTTGDFNLGTSINRFNNLYLKGNISDGSNSASVSDIISAASGGGSAPSNMVTTNTPQNITGDKTFASDAVTTPILKFQGKYSGNDVEIARIYGMYDSETSTRTLKINRGDDTTNVSIDGTLWVSSVGTTSINPGEGDLTYSSSGTSFRPNHTYANNNLGTSTYRWGNLYLAGSISDGTNSVPVSSLKGLVEITWSALKTLRDNGNLVPGRQYRITDYTCTTVTTNTSSAGHVFDIIVVADSANKLNEKARACLHSGDTYFASNNLSAWELWYCLDNDTTRFEWADSTNGKGVIYRMIDEFNNDCPYDFKNILFTEENVYSNLYTFSYIESSIYKDASIKSTSTQKCKNNVIKNWLNNSAYPQKLNFIVVCSDNASALYYYNYFGYECQQNTFFARGFQRNTFGNGFRGNTFGSSTTTNNMVLYNIFGHNCTGNTFGKATNNNTFGTAFNSNVFGDACNSNTFGGNCNHNTFGDNFQYNTLGNVCSYITFGTSNALINYISYNTIETNCHYLYIDCADTTETTSNRLQNVHIHSGITGSSSSNRKTITVPDRALAYSVDYYATQSEEYYV